MDRKYFFFDYDGTLAIPRTREIPKSALETLDKLREQGHFVALATGRLQVNAKEYIQSAGISNIVADGGYSVTLEGKLLYMRPLDVEAARACLKKLDEQNVPWAVTTANELVRYTPCKEFDTYAGDYYVPTKWVAGLAPEDLEEIYKIYLPCTVADEPMLVSSGALDDVPWIRYNPDTIFVEPMDKQYGIKKMMDILHASYSDVVVFGDDKNDVSMFIPDWTCIAMGNAKAEVKQRADYITAKCDDDGIMKACKHFGWIL